MKKEKVDSILSTARLMFIRYGIQKTSLEEIARISRVAKATIYNYFGNKDQVFMEVLNREVADISARIHEAVGQFISPMEKLRAFIFTTFGVVKESADLIYNLVVLWSVSGVRPEQVWAEMERRERMMGIAEKLPKAITGKTRSKMTPDELRAMVVAGITAPSAPENVARRPIVALQGGRLKKRR